MQMGFFFDQSRCDGCYACSVACKDWHDVPAGPASWLRITTIERGKFPDVSVAFLQNSCYHCEQSPCVSACPATAIAKNEDDGIVVVNSDMCLGKEHCDSCLQACPYHAPQFGAERNAKMQKCDFCLERLRQRKKPICVESCPMRAMDAGSLDELRTRYGNIQQAEGFTYFPSSVPSIIFKQK